MRHAWIVKFEDGGQTCVFAETILEAASSATRPFKPIVSITKREELVSTKQTSLCGHPNTSVQNFNRMWGDGDVVCDDCGVRVRSFDSG